ncbi:MAG: hypothetical protein PUE73_01570 [Eubacteriales bacterium]|nr:hypothetical protein [Eubacteriales bacterium]
MKQKSTKMMMTCVGATLAICSGLIMMCGKTTDCCSPTKKTIKKTVNKISHIMDTITAMM